MVDLWQCDPNGGPAGTGGGSWLQFQPILLRGRFIHAICHWTTGISYRYVYYIYIKLLSCHISMLLYPLPSGKLTVRS